MAAMQSWTRCVKKSCFWKTSLDVSLRNTATIPWSPHPRLFSSAGVSVNKKSLGLPLNHSATATARLYSSRGHRTIQREKPKDLYSTLGVPPSATQQQVKDAYYKLSLKYHPDRNRGSMEAHQKFTQLTEAYSVLGQYELRKKYDKGLYLGSHHATHTYVMFVTVVTVVVMAPP